MTDDRPTMDAPDDEAALELPFFGNTELVNALRAATRRAWWAAGTACCVAPVASAIWTPNRSPVLYPILGGAAILGALVGPIWQRRRATRRNTHSSTRTKPISPAVVVAALYPVSCGLGIAIENIEDGGSVMIGVAALGVGSAVGAVAPLAWVVPQNPQAVLRAISIFAAVASVVLLGAYGLGLLLVPLAASYYFASNDARNPGGPRANAARGTT